MEKNKKKSDKTEKELVKNTIDLNPTITEAMGKTAVIAWGRMNPVTVGHEKLVNKIREVARKEKADPHIFLSHSQDPKKNPLSYDDKVDLAKSAFGNIVYKSTAKTIIDVMKQLQGKYKNIIFVGGQDRVNDFETLLTKYNGKEYTFDSIQVVSAGERDPDADDVTGMSASKMRALALAGDEETFKKGLPTKLKTHGNDIYKLVRAGMRISEGLELEEAVLSIQQRLKRAQVMRRLEPRLKMARARAQKRLAPTSKLEKRARKRAIEIIRRKVAGTRGQQYGSLSTGEKIQIDKLVEKRKRAIGRLAKRLLPRVRKDELIRFRQAIHGPHEKAKVNEAFEAFLDEGKRYRALYRKDSTVNPNFRFKRNRKVTEDVELIGIVDELFETIANQSAKVQVALKHKADRSGIDLAFIEAVYHSASNISEQAGFDAVNAYIANWTEMHIHPHLLDPNVPLKHQISKKHRRIDLDQDGDVDEFDKSTPEDISGIEPGIYKKMMRKYAGEKQHSKKHIAYESVDAAFENMLAHPNCGTPNCCGQCETASITEGVNDPSIFKAVFLAGGPGSGKSFIVGKTALTALGFKVINSDDAFERALAKAGLKTTPEDIYSDKGQEVRRGAVALTGKRMDLAMNGRLGLVIDGTGKDYEKIEKQAAKLRDIGYEVAMIFVNTDLDTAKDRNRARARSLPDAEVEAMWNAVQKNIGKFQNFFRQKMFIIDNSDGANFEGAVLGTYRKISAWAKQTPDHPKAKEWIKSQTIKEERTTTPQDPDIKSRPGTQPKGYYKGVPKDKKDDRARHFAYHGKKADNDPSAYAPAPGDEGAKTKESKYTKKYRQMYGETAEEYGAGEWGTTKLTKKYKKDTPHSNVNEAISADSKIDLQKILAMYKKTRPGDTRAAAARDRELEVYKMRVSDGMTFAQIAKELNVSIERARQIEAKAYRRFRQITNRLKEETIDEAFENMNILSGWDNEEPSNYVKHLTKFFGEPDELTEKRAIWYDKDGFKRVEVLDEYILHASPVPHYDYVYSYIDLKVPHDLSNGLVKSSESILIDHLKNEVGARCASLSANAVTLQYVMDVVEGNIRPEKAEYEKRIKSMKKMFTDGKRFELDWWPDVTKDTDPENPYYADDINEAFENMLNEENQCALITQADIRELEKFADSLLNDYGIDVEFTRHFGDRMSDERNTPCINVKELKDFFRKVYVNKGMKIKGNRGIEAILKDLQRNLNMPVVIDYKNGEVEVTFKTIMRKKNFTSPNKSISY